MAIVKGIKEKVHLPLYDSIFVRPGRQLREVSSSSVLRFFVDVRGKTKLETNMRSASLLPHWNTFEARALRVVVSDLPATFPRDVRQSLEQADCQGPGSREADLSRCADELGKLIEEQRQSIQGKALQQLRDHLAGVAKLTGFLPRRENLAVCLETLRAVAGKQSLEGILELYNELHAMRREVSDVLRRTTIAMPDRDRARRLSASLQELGEEFDKDRWARLLSDSDRCLEELTKLNKVLGEIRDISSDQAYESVDAVAGFLQANLERLTDFEKLRERLEELARVRTHRPATISEMVACLQRKVRDRWRIPLKRQLSGRGLSILGQLIYGSVTTFTVGEKVMIQMPTWYFPAGAGPYADDGSAVTHGFPSPEATFRFAEPIFIDTQQNFRIDIEVPEAQTLDDLQRLYGPLFIWVVLDGYMTRDVQ